MNNNLTLSSAECHILKTQKRLEIIKPLDFYVSSNNLYDIYQRVEFAEHNPLFMVNVFVEKVEFIGQILKTQAKKITLTI